MQPLPRAVRTFRDDEGATCRLSPVRRRPVLQPAGPIMGDKSFSVPSYHRGPTEKSWRVNLAMLGQCRKALQVLAFREARRELDTKTS